MTQDINKNEGTEVTEVTALENTGLEPVTPSKNAEVTGVTTAQKAAELLTKEHGLGEIERPCYRVYEHKVITNTRDFKAGTWYHGEKQTKGGEVVKVDSWICGPLHIIAGTSDRQGLNFGLLLKFRNTERQWREWAMPMRMLAKDCSDLRSELLDMGLKIDTYNRPLLPRYLQAMEPKKRMVSTSVTGWHDTSLFILPKGNIGKGEAIFQSEHANHADFTAAGDLERWKEFIGSLLPGNPLLQLAIGAALAGPLLYLLNRQGGGFHFFGDSSTGKTTLAEAACSVWGHGEDFKRTWRSTGNGLEGIAEQRNDTALILDELGEADPKEIGNIVYSLGNGAGKSRANRNGNARPAKRWRLMFVSTGERTLGDMMSEAGKRQQAGQEMRFIELSANRSFGCWDNLHQLEDGAKLSDNVKNGSREYYGTAGPAFVEALINDDLGDLNTAVNFTCDAMQPEGGQEKRGAERFAIVATALELAATYELVPLAPGEATAIMRELFNHWKSNRSNKNAETSAIIKQIADFLSRNGEAMFSPLESSMNEHPLEVRDRAGWWKDENGARVWLFTSEGLRRAAGSTNIKRIAKALDEAGLIAQHDIGKNTKNVRISGQVLRLYCIKAIEGGEA